MSLRRVREDGEIGDVVGFVLTAAESGLTIRDRRGHVHEVAWEQVLAWRQVGVARGRDPLGAPLGELDALARAAGVEGRVFVARLSELLDPSACPPVPEYGAAAAAPGGDHGGMDDRRAPLTTFWNWHGGRLTTMPAACRCGPWTLPRPGCCWMLASPSARADNPVMRPARNGDSPHLLRAF